MQKPTAGISPTKEAEKVMSENRFPEGWNEERVRKVLRHYELQGEEEAIAEDEAAYEDGGQTMVQIPTDLLPAVRELIAKTR